jgi:CRISPR/Cas system CMR subunit Cmr4 (Cas7 group RAMP superfamily)
VLGELATTDSTIDTLREVAQARWGISEETRAAASAAATQIVTRMRRDAEKATRNSGAPS